MANWLDVSRIKYDIPVDLEPMKYATTIVNIIRSYTNRAFIRSYEHGEITLPKPIAHKGFFEVRGSRMNDGIYWNDNPIFSEETFDGYIVYFNIPLDDQSILDMDKILSQRGESGLVRREQLEDYSYTLDVAGTSYGGVPVSLLSGLSSYRVLGGGVENEYSIAGII